jgi:hypothetical protein
MIAIGSHQQAIVLLIPRRNVHLHLCRIYNDILCPFRRTFHSETAESPG